MCLWLPSQHRAVQLNIRFCVWGAFDAHLVEYAYERGYVATLLSRLAKPKTDPVFNVERPRLFHLRRISDVAVAARSHPTLEAALEAVPGFYVLNVYVMNQAHLFDLH